MISPLRRATQVAGERVAVRCGALRADLRGDVGAVHADRRAPARPRARARRPGRRGRRELPPLPRALPGDPGRGAGRRAARPPPRPGRAAARAARTPARRCCSPAPEIGVPPGAAPHVIDLDDGYEAALAAVPPADFPDARRPTTSPASSSPAGRPARPKGVMLTHRNLRRQRAALPGAAGRSGRDDALAGRGAAVRRRGLDRRARHGLERRRADRAAGLRARRRARPDRAAPRDRDARRADDAGRAGRRAARAAARRLLAAR